MNYDRRKLIRDGNNIYWCKPYISDDGKNAFTQNEGMISGFLINGKEFDGDDEEGIHLLAKTVANEYDDLIAEGYDDEEIIYKYLKEVGCCHCPWFEECDALNDDPEWGYMPDFFDLCQDDLEDYGIELIEYWDSYDQYGHYYLDALYIDKNGMYYVHSKNVYGSTSTRMNEEEAKEWAEDNLDVEDYIEIFGEPEE